MNKPIKFLSHDEAVEAYNSGEVVKVTGTLFVISKQPIKMKDPMYVVEYRMSSIRNSFYEIVSKDEYEAV